MTTHSVCPLENVTWKRIRYIYYNIHVCKCGECDFVLTSARLLFVRFEVANETEERSRNVIYEPKHEVILQNGGVLMSRVCACLKYSFIYFPECAEGILYYCRGSIGVYFLVRLCFESVLSGEDSCCWS